MIPDFIEQRIERDARGCWLWRGSISTKGYAKATIEGRAVRVHRWLYELVNGPIGDLTADHLCRVRHCVNPAHIEPVDNRTNVLRGIGPTAQNAKATHCKNGHPLDLVIVRGNGQHVRRCRQCEIERGARYRQRQQEARA